MFLENTVLLQQILLRVFCHIFNMFSNVFNLLVLVVSLVYNHIVTQSTTSQTLCTDRLQSHDFIGFHLYSYVAHIVVFF